MEREGKEKRETRKPCSGGLGEEGKVKKDGGEQCGSFRAANQSVDLTLLHPKTLSPYFPVHGCSHPKSLAVPCSGGLSEQPKLKHQNYSFLPEVKGSLTQQADHPW